jgi:curli production assembly/transport component CsgG
MIKTMRLGLVCFLFIFLAGCGAYFNQPLNTEAARLGESTFESETLSGVVPTTPISVGVYKFRDQTGQYKQVDNGISYSTAVTQGGTSILIKALEDSKWFVPIERENVSNLLNERQIIRSTRQQYDKNKEQVDNTADLPPLLFAGILLEGGVVSYDSNITTGGFGARYFGVGGSTQYRQDRITIYLRAVSTSNGKILKTVYISKTLLSQAIDVNLFRYVNVKRLLEVETGVSQNEPAQMAVKEAIEKAVETLIIEGIIDGLWAPAGGDEVVQKVTKEYNEEVEEAKSTKLLNRSFKDNRGTGAFDVAGGLALMDGDYSNPEAGYNGRIQYRQFLFGPNFNIGVGASMFKLQNENAFSDAFMSVDANLEFILLPHDNLTPYIFGGGGAILASDVDTKFKAQYGLGFEYLPSPTLGLRVFGEQNITFKDDLDGLINGKRDDYFWRFGVGISLYFGKPYKKAQSKIFNKNGAKNE